MHTPLYYAVKYSHLEAARLLLNNDANISNTYEDSSTLLHIAVENMYTDMVKLLLQYGANPNTVNWLDTTPLHHVVWHGKGEIEIVELLLKYGADLNIRDAGQYRPIDSACEQRYHNIIQLLDEYDNY
jgi:ankyrin repeat protein